MAQALREIIKEVLPQEILDSAICSYDIVGDIALLTVSTSCLPWQQQIGEALLAHQSKLRVVAKRAGNYSGEFRVLPITVIAGEQRTYTELRESGVYLGLDLARVYYSGRSGSERLRLASLVSAGERVLVPFSGIAPYPLVLAAKSQASLVVGVEKNMAAHQYALENLKKNRKIKNVELYGADISEWLCRAQGQFERIIMPLPKGGRDFVHDLLAVLSPGGWLHFYEMQQVDHFEDSVDFLRQCADVLGREMSVKRIVRAGHCGPQTYRICVDIQLE